MPRGGSNPRDEFDQMTYSQKTGMTSRIAHLLLGLMVFAALGVVGTSEAYAQDGDKEKVLNGDNVNPNETYNLPPNFDPDYRPKRTPRNIKVTIDFRQAQLEEVVKFYSSMMNKNFIIDDTLQASKTITIISPKPVSINQAYQAFLAALEMNGLTIVPYGSFLKIVSSKTAKQIGGEPIGAGERIPNEARMVTAIIPVENASVDDMQKIIQQFTSPDATIITYGSSFIITDYGHNLRRVQRLIDRLDKSEASDQLYVYKVLHAEATEIQAKLTEIFEVQQANTNSRTNARRNTRRNTNTKSTNSTVDAGGGSDSEIDVEISEIIADERTNQLIILTNERSFERIRQMIELLDVPTTAGGQIHVKFLEYANADDLASTLSSLASGNTNNRNNRSSRTPRTTTSAPAAGGSAAQLLQGDVQITSYRPSNSLIIVASPRDYLALERVIGLLDRPRRQVYVEAVIMELNFKDDLNVGLSYNALAPRDFEGVIPESAVDDGIITDTNGGIIFKTPQSPDTAGGLLALLGPAINIPGISNLGLTPSAFAVYLQATQREDNINILSTPSLMTLDNEEAEIVVGDRVPFPRVIGGAGGLGNLLGAGAGAGANALGGAGAIGGLLGGGLLGNQVQYEDVGITLRITPQVNESKYVRLEVDQEVSSIGAPSDLGPTRSKRSIRTIVLVKDQSTVVIGGLIRDDENETETKVPFMGDIPVIGVLFRSKNTVKTKQNLILMLTPYIIESESDLRKIHERKRKEREELLKLFQKRDIDYMKTVNYEKKGGIVDRMRFTIGDAIDDESARKEALEAFEETGPRYRILGVPTGAAGDGEGEGAGAEGGSEGGAGDPTTTPTPDSNTPDGEKTTDAGE